MVTDYYTAKEVADILDIYAVSAWELLKGTVSFEADELLALAQAKGLTVGQLLKQGKQFPGSGMKNAPLGFGREGCFVCYNKI